MAKTKAKPEIRFAGFTDTWEQRKVEDIAEQTYGGGTPTTSVDEYWTGDIPWIQSSDLKENELFGVVPRKYISSKAIAGSATKLIPQNSIAVITRVGVGKLAFMPYSYASSQDFLSLSGLKMDGKFTAYALYKKLQSELHIVQGTSIKGITKEEMLSKVILAPCQTAEQCKIGAFFAALDRLITLHQREYSKTVNIKKAMLEKMFPNDGADKPEIRFAGFTDTWEQRKLGDITFPSGIKNRDNDYYESYSISNENGFVPQDEQFEHGGTMREADKSMYWIVSPKSFAYNPARINVGSIGYQNLPKNVIVSSLYEVFKTTDDCDDTFLWHWMKSDSFRRLIEQYQEGGVRLYFFYDKFCKGSLLLPKIEEQARIGAFFAALDRLITLHQRELVKLQNMKKALLEKMFV